MKKLLCFLLCLTMIFSSVNLCFASATDWDTSDQANLRYIMQSLTSSTGTVVSALNNIYSRMNTINNNIVDIKNLLSYGGHSIADLIDSILTWMSPIYNSITSLPTDLTSIKEALWKPLDNGSQQAYLSIIEKSISNITGSNSADAKVNNHWSLLDSWNGFYSFRKLNLDGSSQTTTANWYNGSPIGNLAVLTRNLNDATVIGFTYLLQGFGTTQTYTDWSDLSSDTFTPTTLVNGLYNWFSNIQQPVARLSYVLASDERITAQESAAANEEAVVDNFIDSSGDGAASPSDIGSVSGLSSGYKQNFATDASPSGIFDIFNSDHATWFSQETKNQLDTTTPTRLSKGSASETPLLDKQIEDIYNALGVKQP